MRSVFGLIALGALAATIGCGGGYKDSTPEPGPVPGSSGSAGTPSLTINIIGEKGAQSFSPNPADAGGMVVVFHNSDSIVHRVVLNDGTVDTGDILPNGNSRSIAMPSDGTNYHCSLHPEMVGAVNSVAGPPPTCTGPYCVP
jgi:plastocyanin